MLFQNLGLLDLDTPALVIILAIVLLLFGGKKLPQLSRSLGESMKELRKGVNGDVNENKTSTEKQAGDKDPIA